MASQEFLMVICKEPSAGQSLSMDNSRSRAQTFHRSPAGKDSMRSVKIASGMDQSPR
jgi:hypothetical protein